VEATCSDVSPAVEQLMHEILVGEHRQCLLQRLEVVRRKDHCGRATVPGHHDPIVGGHQLVDHLGEPILHLGQQQRRHS